MKHLPDKISDLSSKTAIESSSKAVVEDCPEAVKGGSCPVCGEGFEALESLIRCSRCDTYHHKECWDYNDGCAIYGCKASLTLARDSAQAEVAIVSDLVPEQTISSRLENYVSRAIVALSYFSAIHWYVAGLSLVSLSLVALGKLTPLWSVTAYLTFQPLVGVGPYDGLLRGIVILGFITGFFTLLFAGFIEESLRRHCPHHIGEKIKLPEDYSPKEIDALLLNNDKNVNILELAGFLYYSLGKFERAADLYEKALAMDSEHQNCVYQLGRCYGELGRLHDSLEAFHKSWQMNKISGIGQKSRWWADLIKKQIAENVTDCNECL
jgi:tetratricopeptide (TPR) repeat protein